MHFDLFVIGSGPAGQRAAIQGAKLGKRIGICERKENVGGVCINTGTIPSKTFREAALFLTGYRQKGLYGPSFTVKENVTISDMAFRCDHMIQREVGIIRDQLRRNRVAIIAGEASFADPNKLLIRGAERTTEVTADNIVIATGTVSSEPKGVPVDGETLIVPDHVHRLKELPRSMIVVGGGVIGIEYASMFTALGVEVTLVDSRKRMLEFVDAEIVDSLIYQMRAKDCTFRLGEEVVSVKVEGPHRAAAVLKSGKRLVAEVILYSVGRRGATDGLNLAAAGLAADERGRLVVDATFRTAQPHIFAAGDVIGFPALASTSMEQGRLAACNAFGIGCTSLPHLFPYGIYAVPEISMVGKTEEELTAAAVPYEVGVARYREIARGGILGDDTGLLKILFHRETREILGVHIIGTDATELVHIGQAAMAFKGTLDYFVTNVFNYPTFAECYKVAALDGYNKVCPTAGTQHCTAECEVHPVAQGAATA